MLNVIKCGISSNLIESSIHKFMERQLVSTCLKPCISGLKVAYWSIVGSTQIMLISFDKCCFVYKMW